LCGVIARAPLGTLAQVADWQDLQRKIFIARRREQPMQKRVHQLWIPGFLTFILSMIFLIALQELGFQPRIVGSGPNTILFYAPWLASLPFFGALGAYLSARRGGLPRTMLLVSVFPVLVLTTAFLLMFPIGFVIEGIIGRAVDLSVLWQPRFCGMGSAGSWFRELLFLRADS
jgi:hypothetical protein